MKWSRGEGKSWSARDVGKSFGQDGATDGAMGPQRCDAMRLACSVGLQEVVRCRKTMLDGGMVADLICCLEYRRVCAGDLKDQQRGGGVASRNIGQGGPFVLNLGGDDGGRCLFYQITPVPGDNFDGEAES